MHHNIILPFFTLPIILFLAFLSSTTKGLVAPLIPPMSPQSPFYTQILEANNISITSNITLNEDHYMRWLLSKTSVSLNDESEVFLLKKAGDHVMNLNIGNPIQKMYGIFDTGSGIVWFQCMERERKSKFPVFHQRESLTYTSMKCDDHRCKNYNQVASINVCESKRGLCKFEMKYGDGGTANGVMSTDRVTFEKPGWKVLLQFVFGCSWENSPNLSGIIGASNSMYSLPKQLNSNDPKFSYCISGDLSKTNLVSFGNDAKLQGQPLNMKINSFTNLYYLNVVGIKVNGKNIDVPPSAFEMSIYGEKGLFIDSGTSLTTLTSEIFEALKTKIVYYLGPPIQHMHFEICYPGSKFLWPWVVRPIIGLEFYPNGAFEFEEKKIWQRVADSGNLECLKVLRERDSDIQFSILGVLNLLDVNVGYDPNNKHLYLQKSTCPSV